MSVRLPITVLLISLSLGCKPKPVAVPSTGTDKKTASVNAYVADTKCRECHSEISDHFADHSMGRSLKVAGPVDETKSNHNIPFQADGYRYSVFNRDDKQFHRQARIDVDGNEMAVIEMPVDFAVGSGHHGVSYLLQDDKYLFMSPLTWYPDKQIWDLSPGFEKRNSQFNRPIIEVCLFCHSNRVEADANTLNGYRKPLFRGHAIGCQRCHGPGEHHVQHHESGANGEDEIVNPRSLSFAQREAVCQQCHLSGAARVMQPGKSLHDFRPGEAIDLTYAIYLIRPDLLDEDQFVGQVEQMYESTCFQLSNEKMGCTSCHDPHRLPAEEERVAYYRERCLHCHQQQGCSEEMAVRKERTAEDSCIVCHMPTLQTEIRHAATTDHRIPRRPGNKTSNPEATNSSWPVVRFPTRDNAKQTSVQQERNLALAVVLASASHPNIITQRHFQEVLPILKKCADRDPSDIDVLEALGEVHLSLRNASSAVATYKRVLQANPKREYALSILAEEYGGVGQHQAALGFWQRAIEVNPSMSRHWYGLCRTYGLLGQWKECLETALSASERFPTSVGLRKMIVESHLELGQRAEAEAAFDWLRRFQPRGYESLREWFNSHPRR